MMAVTWDVLRYDTVDSTNNVCKALAAQGLDSTAVIPAEIDPVTDSDVVPDSFGTDLHL